VGFAKAFTIGPFQGAADFSGRCGRAMRFETRDHPEELDSICLCDTEWPEIEFEGGRLQIGCVFRRNFADADTSSGMLEDMPDSPKVPSH
jgi:hypothetical protein